MKGRGPAFRRAVHRGSDSGDLTAGADELGVAFAQRGELNCSWKPPGVGSRARQPLASQLCSDHGIRIRQSGPELGESRFDDGFRGCRYQR